MVKSNVSCDWSKVRQVVLHSRISRIEYSYWNLQNPTYLSIFTSLGILFRLLAKYCKCHFNVNTRLASTSGGGPQRQRLWWWRLTSRQASWNPQASKSPRPAFANIHVCFFCHDYSLWWLAFFIFPVLAGTFGPIAAAFSICALSQSWILIQTEGAKQEIVPPRLVNTILVQCERQKDWWECNTGLLLSMCSKYVWLLHQT